ncbi:MAG: Holliday junction branch migration protein RuvA [Candidatus Pacebacteria bacterium]|nr:Holliday junction branch migration protein RuvA [Candidatus Paceibacterota bacterium]
MIASIKGKIILIKDKFVVIESNDIGYKVYLSPENLLFINDNKENINLWIHHHIREESSDLYGFLEYEELEFFQMLLDVSGIGPKGALTILGVAPSNVIKKAIKQNDLAYLTKISGIGKKTAEKMILELRDKLGELDNNELGDDLDVLEALKALGYNNYQVRNVIKELPKDLDTNSKIREALKALGQPRHSRVTGEQ